MRKRRKRKSRTGREVIADKIKIEKIEEKCRSME